MDKRPTLSHGPLSVPQGQGSDSGVHTLGPWSEANGLIEVIVEWTVGVVVKTKRKTGTREREGGREGGSECCSGIDGVKIVIV